MLNGIRLMTLMVLTTSSSWLVAAEDLTSLSLEELMDLEVVTVSRRAQKSSEVAAAVYVITQDEIKNSTARSIPELLRRVPGLQVAQIDTAKWAITARGFNGRFANKLQVLIDGRSVYNGLFSGVYWEAQDLLLEDIERIEIVRGPGAALWGANAVNGVINIITRTAHDSRGGMVRVEGSPAASEVQIGARYALASQKRAFRWSFQGRGVGNRDVHHQHLIADLRELHFGNFLSMRTGFRYDHTLWGEEGGLSLQGDLYAGREEVSQDLEHFFGDSFSGGYLLSRVSHSFSEGNSLQSRLSYEHSKRSDFTLRDVRDTFEVDLEHQWQATERLHLVSGFSFRSLNHQVFDAVFEHHENSQSDQLWSSFVQGEIDLIPDRLGLTAGSRFEWTYHAHRNGVPDFKDHQILPNLRLRLKLNEESVVWAAASRAVRTPSRPEHETTLTRSIENVGGDRVSYEVLQGDRRFRSEGLRAYELGYRRSFGTRWRLDATLFHNTYRDLRTLEPDLALATLQGLPATVFRFSNQMNGRVMGGEGGLQYRPRAGLFFDGNYSYLRMNLEPHAGSMDLVERFAAGRSPRHQFFLRGNWDMGRALHLIGEFRQIGSLPAIQIPSYRELDVRLAWRRWEDKELFVTGRNLLHSGHPEFAPILPRTTAISTTRSIQAGLRWVF